MPDSTNDTEFDVFVSYDELTGEEYAEKVLKALTRRGYKVFVAHIERPKIDGNFEDHIDKVIANCSIFAFINTYDSLSRPQIIREFNQAFPDGKIGDHKPWFFRHDKINIPYSTDEFAEKTKMELSGEMQAPFKSSTELATNALIKCDKKKLEKTSIDDFVKEDEEFTENQKKEFSEAQNIKRISKEFEKRGYDIEYEHEIGNHLSLDLLLKKDSKWIVCEYKRSAEKVTSKVFSQLVKFKTELENIERVEVELWLIGNGNFQESIQQEATKYNVRIIDDSNIEKILSKNSVYLSIPKTVVLYGETIKVKTRVEKIEKNPLILKIIDQKGNKLFEKEIFLTSEKSHEEEIKIIGKQWESPGGWYSITAEYGQNSSSITIWRSNFGATIELDQKIYSCTDRVYITLVAPDFMHKEFQEISIKTGKTSISNYQLKQVKSNSGIFIGEFKLSGSKEDFTGNEKYIHEYIGKTSGTGHKDGIIACKKDDSLKISYSLDDETIVEANALIKWTIGEIQWSESTYPALGEGIIRIIDPDMNLNPDNIDYVEIKIWSDTDTKGKIISIPETSENSGIFEKKIKFNIEETENSLLISEGDMIYAEYQDFTLPKPYENKNELKISATTMIGTLCPPLARVSIDNVVFHDEDGKELTKIEAKKPTYILAKLSNLQEKEQKFSFFIQVMDKFEKTVFTGSESGKLKPHEKFNSKIKWIPKNGGTFEMSFFVWESKFNPTALGGIAPMKVHVKGKERKQNIIEKTLKKSFLKSHKVEKKSKKITLIKNEKIVMIPNGSAAPGCEEENRCYIPSELRVKINTTVKWINEDDAAHTITSGIPSDGPDGKFDSGLFMSGKNFSHKFSQKGTYPYFDLVHPWQTGVIIVMDKI